MLPCPSSIGIGLPRPQGQLVAVQRGSRENVPPHEWTKQVGGCWNYARLLSFHYTKACTLRIFFEHVGFYGNESHSKIIFRISGPAQTPPSGLRPPSTQFEPCGMHSLFNMSSTYTKPNWENQTDPNGGILSQFSCKTQQLGHPLDDFKCLGPPIPRLLIRRAGLMFISWMWYWSPKRSEESKAPSNHAEHGALTWVVCSNLFWCMWLASVASFSEILCCHVHVRTAGCGILGSKQHVGLTGEVCPSWSCIHDGI